MNDGQGQAKAQPLDPAVQIFQNVRANWPMFQMPSQRREYQVLSAGLMAMLKTLENGSSPLRSTQC